MNEETKKYDLEIRTTLSQLLGADFVYEFGRKEQEVYSWPEIHSTIGRLRERAETKRVEYQDRWISPPTLTPLTITQPSSLKCNRCGCSLDGGPHVC